MELIKTAISSFAGGAVLMYFADPNRGKRRRAITRDKMVAGWRDVTNEFDKARRDLLNRAHGAAARARTLWNGGESDGYVLVDRVRSRIGRAVSHPHAITTLAEESGRVTLEGPVLASEVEYLLKSVKSVPGVHEVISRLEVHEEPGGIASLQGGHPRQTRSEFAQEHWTPSLRVAAGAVGSGALIYSCLRSRGPACVATLVGGGLLLARAVTNKGFRQLFGVGPGPGVVTFDKVVHIAAPVNEVFSFWSNFENFPRFMTHLKEARDLGNGRSHWVATGPGGISIPWDAEMTEYVPNQQLAWRSVPGSLIDTSGVVRFDEDPAGGTRLLIRMSYCPPAGMFGHAVASLFGADPKSEINDDMVRLKSLIEIGKTRAHGVRVTREEVGVARG